MKSGKVLLGVLAGVAAGAALGILFAPDKGSKTRKKILRKGGDYADEVKEKFNGLLENITEKYEAVTKEAEAIVAKGKAKLEDSKKELKNGVIS
ncbi:YtxH domain-containing protein [Ferruginibacter sp.]